MQRARATIASHGNTTAGSEPLTPDEARLLDRYVDAFQNYDVDALVSLLREDATLSMPPHTLWLRGPATIRERGFSVAGRMSRIPPASDARIMARLVWPVSSGPGGGHAPWALVVLELEGDRITAWNSFLDTRLFPLFGLPQHLPA